MLEEQTQYGQKYAIRATLVGLASRSADVTSVWIVRTGEDPAVREEVRNRMAHRLDPGNLDELLGSVAEKLGPGYVDRFKTPLDRFRAAAFCACGYFDSIRGSIRLREAYATENEV